MLITVRISLGVLAASLALALPVRPTDDPVVLVPTWRESFGPLDMRMPDDGVGTPIGPDGIHEDNDDCLNPDGTAGPLEPGNPGGTGIVFGYSVADLDNVLRLEAGTYNRPVKYDWEHWIRQIRYSITAWEMTRDPLYARHVVQYWELAHEAWSERGEVHLGDPGWIPMNIHQYHEMALANPHQGTPMNGRAAGWVAYNCAAAMSVTTIDPAWAEMFLETCELAAIPGTGQVIVDDDYGAHPIPVQYSFHWAILAHGALALCHQMGRPVPDWIVTGMVAMANAPHMTYEGFPSPPSFMYTINGSFVPESSELQAGDPAHGWWSNNCAVLYRMTGSVQWLNMASMYGPTENYDEQSKKQTILIRGILR
jgi:hypothetical protein